MLKTVATLPFMAALLASNVAGMELVAKTKDDDVESAALEALYTSMSIKDSPHEGTHTRRSRMRRASHATVFPIRTRKAEHGHKRSSSLTVEEQKCIARHNNENMDWRPLYQVAEKGVSIRRIYPNKNKGRAHLAPIDAARLNGESPSRRSSFSSAASLRESPSMSPIGLRSDASRRSSSRQEDAKTDELHSTPTCNQTSTNGQSGTTMIDEAPSVEPSIVMPADAVVSDSAKSPFSNNIGLSSFKPQRLPFNRSTSESSTGASRLTAQNLHRKGHARNESIASVWTVDSSPDSSRSTSPVTTRRKPLSLHFRPPIANFNAEPLTAPLGKTFSFPAIDENEVISDRTDSVRPPIPPRTSSRHGSAYSGRPRSASTGLPLDRPHVHASESWDDDFGDSDVEVPTSVRMSQQKVRSHLLLFRQFSEVIAELERMRDRQVMAPSRFIPQDHQIWHEVDAIIAIASRGQESASVNDIQYRGGAQDDIISSILGQFRRDGGRVRLNDRILETLIDKAQSLVADIEYVASGGLSAQLPHDISV